jgi:hypothetical protein
MTSSVIPAKAGIQKEFVGPRFWMPDQVRHDDAFPDINLLAMSQ